MYICQHQIYIFKNTYNVDKYIPREYKMTYGPMFVDQDDNAWVTASDGIYTTSGGALTKICTNTNNWTLSGIAVMSVMGTPTLFVSTSDESSVHAGTLFSYSVADLADLVDVSDFNIVTTDICGSIVCLATDGSKLYYIDWAYTLHSHDSLPGGEETLASMPGSPTNMCYMNGLYVNTTDAGIFFIDLASLDVSPTANSSPGPVAVDSAGNIYGASTGLFKYNVTTSDWTQVGTAAIETVGISGVGYCIDATSNVYTMTFSESGQTSITLTGAVTTTLPPTTTTTTEKPSEPLIISKNAWASVTNVVLAIDTTVDKSYVFEDISSTYHIDVDGGVISFTNPSGTTVLQVGSTITLNDGTTSYTFAVVDLNLTLNMVLPKPSLIISKNAWASVTNVVLAIDTTVDKSYFFEDISEEYYIDVEDGVLTFTNPSGTTTLQVGSNIALRDGASTHTFTVADLNLTLTNLTTSQFNPNATNPVSTLFKGTFSAFASDISAATLAGIPDEAILVEAILQAHVGNNTDIYSILPDFYSGSTISISSTDISGLYTLLEQDGSTISTAQKAKGLDVCVPDKATHTIAISTSSTNNVMLPIDLNSQLTYPLSLSLGNFSGYSITVDTDKNQLFQKDGTTISTINYGDVNGTLTFTEGPDTFTIDVLHYDLVGSFDAVIPTARHKAVLANQLLWVLTPAALSVFDGNNLNRVITFNNVTAISFALDVSNSVLYLATSMGLYTSSYPAGNQFTINVADLTQVTLNGDPFIYAVVDMTISNDTLYLANPSGNVNSLPLSAINGTGTLTNYAVTTEGGDQLIPLALTFANNSVYVSANTSITGTLIKLSADLTFIERNNFPPNATQIMLNRASIVYAAIGNQLWANDYVHLNDVSGANGTHNPVTSDTVVVALASNVNDAVNDTDHLQINYVVNADGNIYMINPVFQDVMGIGLVQVYPVGLPPPSVTVNSGSTVTDILTLLGSNSASAVLAAALSGGVSHAVILLAFAEYAATNGTAIFSSYAGTVLVGANATISAANASALYAKLGVTGAAATKSIYISVPNAGVLTLGPTDINTSLAIDDTVTATYSFAGYPGYSLSITTGTQTFITPTGSAVLSQGSTITLTNGSGSVTYPVLSLDLTVGADISVPVCFLGDAPVKTPHGYRRMDSLKVGDRVSTFNGSAVIQHIHCQDYAAGPSANPYVIPKGRFGATQDLLISPRHKVAVNGRMVEARDLDLTQKDMGTLTYYNLGLGGANMIVAGVLVESLAPMARMTISRAEFNMILAAKYGGRMTPEIAAACHFDGDRVSVPYRR